MLKQVQHDNTGNTQHKMLKIGIECHNLEGERFGVGQTLIQLLESISARFNLEPQKAKNEFRFVLYFKKMIPDDPVLNNPIFEKRVLKFPFLPASFNIFYHILIPFYYFKDRLDGFFFPSYMLPAFFMGKSIVVLTNDAYYEAHFGNLPLKYKLAYRIFCYLAAKRANKIMTISEFSKKELARLYDIRPERIAVIPWGLNETIKKLEQSPENDAKFQEIKKRIGITNKFILSVGQAFPRRKVKESMEAFAKIADKFHDIQYVVASIDRYNPPIIDNLAEEINEKIGREDIIRTKYLSQDDISRLFNNTELLIYISSQEAMGLPPMEALKCGSVPLVADNELTREIFGDNAFFANNIEDPQAIAETIQKAITDTAKREGIIKDGQIAMQKFSWTAHSDKILKLFKETF